jgi:hypothetical protein
MTKWEKKGGICGEKQKRRRNKWANLPLANWSQIDLKLLLY